MGKSLKTVISVSKRTQGVAPRPKPVRVLLSLCGLDLRSVVWWRGVSPKILATIKLLSPGLLGDTVTSLWKLRSIETCMAEPFTKINHLALNASEKIIPEVKEALSRNYGIISLISTYRILSNFSLRKIPFMVKFRSPWA